MRGICIRCGHGHDFSLAKKRDPSIFAIPIREMDRGVEQLVARRAHNPKVAGSSPATATSASLKAEEKRKGQHGAGPFLFSGQ